jgi:hypothetical protein
MAARATSKPGDAAMRGREIVGIVLMALGLFLAAALLSLQLGDGSLMGPLGRASARLLATSLGLAAHLVPAILIVIPVRLLAGRRVLRGPGEAIGFALGALAIAILLHLALGGGGGGVAPVRAPVPARHLV